MNSARKLLIFGGLTLAAFGMLYGLHYALFVEHQTLDAMGASLTEAFVNAAERHVPESNSAIDHYARTKYIYVRQVDVHSHWTGLAMLLFVLGVAFDQIAFAARARLWIAAALLMGAIVFPLGVLLQTSMRGPLPSVLAVVGVTLETAALLVIVVGFARGASAGGHRAASSPQPQRH